MGTDHETYTDGPFSGLGTTAVGQDAQTLPYHAWNSCSIYHGEVSGPFSLESTGTVQLGESPRFAPPRLWPQRKIFWLKSIILLSHK